MIFMNYQTSLMQSLAENNGELFLLFCLKAKDGCLRIFLYASYQPQERIGLCSTTLLFPLKSKDLCGILIVSSLPPHACSILHIFSLLLHLVWSLLSMRSYRSHVCNGYARSFNRI